MSISPGVRLIANDSSYITLQEIYEQHCEKIGISREDPVLVAGDKCKAVFREGPVPVRFFFPAHHRNANPVFPTLQLTNRAEILNLKKAIVDEVTAKMVPDDVVLRVRVDLESLCPDAK